MSQLPVAVEVPGPPGPHRFDGSAVVLYPDQTDGERGTYSLAAAGFVDELAGEGIDVHPYHDLDHSDWTGERDPIVLGLVLGIASSAAWDAIKLLLRRRPGGPPGGPPGGQVGGQPGGQISAQVKVTVGFRQGDQIRWVQAEGDGPAVAAALDRLNPWEPPSP